MHEDQKITTETDVVRTEPSVAPVHPIGQRHTGVSGPERRKVSWGAVIAGALTALAAMITLGLLGLGVGLWSVEPGGEPDTLGGMTAGTVIWSVLTMLLSLFAGGYVASRMSATYDKQSSVFHGLLVWSLATVGLIWLAASATQALFKTAVGAVGSISSGLASAAKAVTPDSLPEFQLPEISMNDLPPELQQSLRNQGMTPENFKAESREAFRNVISESEQAQIREDVMATATDIIRTPGDASSDLKALGDDLFGPNGVISQEDRDEAIAVMQRRTGVTEAEATQTLERWETKARQTFDSAQQSFQTAQEKVVKAGDAATDAAGKAAIVSFLGLLLGAGAAAGGAALGRREHPYEHDDYLTGETYQA